MYSIQAGSKVSSSYILHVIAALILQAILSGLGLLNLDAALRAADMTPCLQVLSEILLALH